MPRRSGKNSLLSSLFMIQLLLGLVSVPLHSYADQRPIVKKGSEIVDDLGSLGFARDSRETAKGFRVDLLEQRLRERRSQRESRAQERQLEEGKQKNIAQQAYVANLLELTDLLEEITSGVPSETRPEYVNDLARIEKRLDSLNKKILDIFKKTEKKCISEGFDRVVLDRCREFVGAHTEDHNRIMGLLGALHKFRRPDKPSVPEWTIFINEMEDLLDFLRMIKLKEDPPLLSTGALPYSIEKKQPRILPISMAESILGLPAKGIPKDIRLEFSPPVPGDLSETIDVQIGPEITALAASLNNSPYEIFKHVRDSFEFDAYMGSRKGSTATLRERSGNADDLASLLIALLRASNIPARYCSGTIFMPVDQLTHWLGIDDINEAGNLVATALDADAAIWSDGDGPFAVAFRHVWVLAYIPFTNYRGLGNDDTGEMWIPMDPSVKEYAYHEGIDVLAEMGFDADTFIFDEYISSFHDLSPVELYVQRIQEHLTSVHPGLTYQDVARFRSIEPFGLEVLPGSTPYLVATGAADYAEIPADQRYQIRFHIHEDGATFIDYTANLPDIASKRVTISYVAATQADQDVIDSYGGLYETPPYLVYLKPVLKIDGESVATGPDSGIMMGITHDSDLYFYPPVGAGNAIPAVDNPIISGTYQGIGIDTGRIPGDIFVPTGEGEIPDTDEFTGGKLYRTAMGYLQKVERAEDRVEETMRMVVTKDVSEAIVENTVLVTYSGSIPSTFEWRALTVDADRSIAGPFSVDGDSLKSYDYMVLTGADGSISENRIFEDMYDEEAISAVKILELASDMGISVCRITDSIDGDCPGNSWPAHVTAAVAGAIAQGHEVTIPRTQITYHEWTGLGYIDMDPATGAAGYIISGGQAGGSTVDFWISWKMVWFTIFRSITNITAAINHPAPNEYFPHISWWDLFGWSLYFDVDYTIHYDDGSNRTVNERYNPHYPYPPDDYVFYAGWGTGETVDLTVFGVEIDTPDGDECLKDGPSLTLQANVVPRTPPSGNLQWKKESGAGDGTFTPSNVDVTEFSGTQEGTLEAQAEVSNSNGATEEEVDLEVLIVNVEITSPHGDPTTSAGANSTNERTFSTSSTGVLTVQCEATPESDTPDMRSFLEQNRVRWTIDSIGGSTLSWSSSWPGDSTKGEGLSATATFSGLPSSNGSLGLKQITMEVLMDGSSVDVTDATNIEVFYSKTATNHPGGSSPNWFYYWNQSVGDPDAEYSSRSGIYGAAPAMWQWSPTMTYSKTTLWICDPSAGQNTQPDNDVTTGIDCFVDVIRHENTHVTQISQADPLLGTLNGQSGSIWEKGWSWNYSPNNHWTLGPDGGAGVAGVDDDGDTTVDEVNDNSEVGFAGSDDADLDTDNDNVPNSYETASPAWIEPAAYAAETTVEHANASNDWGSPGKRHATLNRYYN